MNLHRAILTGGLALLLMGSITACGNANQGNDSADQDGNKADKTKPTITLYNGQHEATTKALVTAFEKQTGVQVKVRSGESSELVNQIAEEGNKSPADVIYTEESTSLSMLAEKNLLAKINDSTLGNIPQKYSGQNGDWVGVTARTRVVAYNPSMVKESELPDSVLDFAKPKWKGKVGYVPTSGAFQEQIIAITKINGEKVAKQWLEGLKKYGKAYNHNDTALKAADRGEVAVALVNNYYWYRVRDELGADKMHTKLYYFGHRGAGNLVTISGAAVLKSSPHKKAAQEFVNFMVSKKGQEVLKNKSYEYPLNPNVKRTDIKPFSEILAPNIGPTDLGDGQKALELEQEVGLR